MPIPKIDPRKVAAAIKAMRPGAVLMLQTAHDTLRDFPSLEASLQAQLKGFHPGDQAVILVCMVRLLELNPTVARNIAAPNPIMLKTYLTLMSL